MSKREIGTIKWYSPRKSFGFIVGATDNAEIFFHINDCREFVPEINMTVEYETGFDRIKRLKAMNIERVSVGVDNEYSRNKATSR